MRSVPYLSLTLVAWPRSQGRKWLINFSGLQTLQPKSLTFNRSRTLNRGKKNFEQRYPGITWKSGYSISFAWWINAFETIGTGEWRLSRRWRSLPLSIILAGLPITSFSFCSRVILRLDDHNWQTHNEQIWALISEQQSSPIQARAILRLIICSLPNISMEQKGSKPSTRNALCDSD